MFCFSIFVSEIFETSLVITGVELCLIKTLLMTSTNFYGQRRIGHYNRESYIPVLNATRISICSRLSSCMNFIHTKDSFSFGTFRESQKGFVAPATFNFAKNNNQKQQQQNVELVYMETHEGISVCHEPFTLLDK